LNLFLLNSDLFFRSFFTVSWLAIPFLFVTTIVRADSFLSFYQFLF
jgi:hypothetical protein